MIGILFSVISFNGEPSLVLTENNISISQIFYQKQDLESYFLSKIGGKDNV